MTSPRRQSTPDLVVASLVAGLLLGGCPHEPPGGAANAKLAASTLPRAVTRRLPRSMDLWLPSSTSTQPVQAAPRLTITRHAVLWVGRKIIAIKDGAVDPSLKADGADGYFIKSLHAALADTTAETRRRAKQGGKPFDGTLSVVADHTTPYRLLAEVLYSAGQAEYGRYQLVVDGGRGKRQAILLLAPSYGSVRIVGTRQPAKGKLAPRLNLTVVTSYGGHELSGGSGPGATGLFGTSTTRLRVACQTKTKHGACRLRAPESTLGAWVDGYDYATLHKQALALKRAHPQERWLIFSAHRRVPLQVVVNSLDALRGTPSADCAATTGCLFDRVIFSAGVD